jgi:parallel beta-helix repeat protein
MHGGIITPLFIYIILGLLILSIPPGMTTGRTIVITDITHISSSQSTSVITRSIDEARSESDRLPELLTDDYRSTSSQYTFKGIRPNVSVAHDLLRSSQSANIPEVRTSEYTYDIGSFGHIPHDPISIDGNAAFAAGGWPGDGSALTPYRIENYVIDGSGSDCISIRNTDVYFIIDNCTLQEAGGGQGIFLSNVANGQVIETLISETCDGLFLNYTSDCTFYDCTFESEVWMEVGPLYGLTFDYCTFLSGSGISTYSISIDYLEITNCDFYGVGAGEALYMTGGGSHLTIDHCNFMNQQSAAFLSNFDQSSVTNCNFTDGYWGFALGGSDNTVAHNLFKDNGEGVTDQPYALNIYGDNCHVYDNTFSNNSRGIVIRNSIDSVIEYNTFTESLEYGIEISEGDSSITVAHNTLTDNTYGMWLEDSSMENTIWNNTCNNNILDGIFIDGGSLYTIFNNTCMNNGRHGVVLYDNALDNTIERNIVSGNIVGILLESIWTSTLYFYEKNTIIDNDCYDNEYGICMLDAYYTIVTENDCTLNNWDGITITGTSETNTINNNFCDNNIVDGIYVNSTGENLIDYNLCSNNLWGIFLNQTFESVVSNNTCEYNDIGIYLWSDSENTQHELIRNICRHNSVAGIGLDNADYNDLEHNTCTFNNHGIYIFVSSRFNDLLNNTCNENTGNGIFIDASTYNEIAQSNCSLNTIGIYLSDADGGVIESSYCGGNTLSGIHLESTSHTDIIGNMLKDTGIGIVLYGSNCELTDNICIENTVGIGMSLSSLNTLTNNVCNDNTQHGTSINTCSNNMIEQMECTGNGVSGIRIAVSTYNEFYYCELSLNQYGVYLSSGDFNTVGNSSIHANTVCGIQVDTSLNSTVVWNSIEDNTQNALDNSANNTFDYNYWSNYTGVDANSDGYGDTPHDIPGTAINIDSHPLVYSPLAPEWVTEPSDQAVEYTEDLSYDLDVTCDAPVTGWWLSDTTHFSVDSNGVITNIVPLELNTDIGGPRYYPLEVSVDNIYGSSTTASFTVIVDDTIAPTITSPDDLTYVDGTTGHSISWNVSDASLREYEISVTTPGLYIENIYDELHTTVATITVDLDEDVNLFIRLGFETVYNITIMVQDDCFNQVFDTVLVTLTEHGVIEFPDFLLSVAIFTGLIVVVLVVAMVFRRRRAQP